MERLSRVDFVNKVENQKIKNGTEFRVLKGEKEIAIVAVQRTMVIYVGVPSNITDLLLNDEYEFLQIEETE